MPSQAVLSLCRRCDQTHRAHSRLPAARPARPAVCCHVCRASRGIHSARCSPHALDPGRRGLKVWRPGAGVGSLGASDCYYVTITRRRKTHRASPPPAAAHRPSTTASRSQGKELPEWEVCVVGAGMTGAAAARHLARAGRQVVVIGPQEPPRESWDRADVLEAHYDEGRITRKTDPDPVWAYLAQRSIGRYSGIEEQTGVRFYHEVGHLAVGPAGSATVTDRTRNAEEAGVEHETLGQAELERRFPYLSFGAGVAAVHELMGAGWVSGRGQVAAQLKAAELNGCRVVSESVVSVKRCQDGHGGYLVRTHGGGQLQAAKVLLACGAFTNSRPLIPGPPAGAERIGADAHSPRHQRLDIRPMTAQVVRVEIGPEDVDRLADMPSVIYKSAGAQQHYRHSFAFKAAMRDHIPADDTHGDDFWCYILPPIEYPDGKIYLKIGGGVSKTPHPQVNGRVLSPSATPGKYDLPTHEDILAWYRGGGDPQAAKDMLEALHDIIPGLSPIAWHSDACATCQTPTNRAYVGVVDPSEPELVVLTGGNGVAAKSADELGRIAAACVMHGETAWEEIDFPGMQQALRPLFLLEDEDGTVMGPKQV